MSKKKNSKRSKGQSRNQLFVVIGLVIAGIVILAITRSLPKSAPRSQQEIDAIVETLNLARDIDGTGCWLWDGNIVYDPSIIGGMVYQDENGYGCRLNRITIGFTYSYEGARCTILKEYFSLQAERWLWEYLNRLGIQPLNEQQFISGYNVMGDYYGLRELDLECQTLLRDEYDAPFTPRKAEHVVTCRDVEEAAQLSANYNIAVGDLTYFRDICI